MQVYSANSNDFFFNISTFSDLVLNCSRSCQGFIVGKYSVICVNTHHNFLICYLVSGRCWIFSSLNVMRIPFMKKLNIEEFEFSQSYLFFWDKVWDWLWKIFFVSLSTLRGTISSFLAFQVASYLHFIDVTPFVLISRVSKADFFKGRAAFGW